MLERLSNVELSLTKHALVQTTGLGKTASNRFVTLEPVHAHTFVRGILFAEHAGRIGTTLEGASSQVEGGGVGWHLASQVATHVRAALLDACAVVIVRALVAFCTRGTRRDIVALHSSHLHTFAWFIDELLRIITRCIALHTALVARMRGTVQRFGVH